MRTLYNSLIYPYFTYCIEAWGNICQTHLDPLLKIQRRAVRTIVGAKKLENTDPIFKRLKLLNVNEVYIYCVQLFMYRYHHDILPSAFDNMFVSNMLIHSHFTRIQHLLHVPIIRTNVAKTIRVTGVTLYNYFHNHVSMERTYDSYKYNLKMFIRDNDASEILTVVE